MGFDRIKIKKWSHLAKAFLKKYQLNLELAHDRITSQNTKKRADGIVKEYAQR
jgi:hypothetical protein